MLDSLCQDVRIGLRVLIKEKSFCLLAVLVLGLGICGVTTQFAVVNALVLRGFSFPHPEQLMSVGLIDPQASDQNNNFGAGNIPSLQDYEDMRASQQSFAMMAAYLNGSTINMSYRGTPQRYTGAYVTDDFFKIIAVRPIMGRDFTAADNKPGGEKAAILSHKIWQRDFNGDPKIIGQAIRINGRSATIIGVMPPDFEFPNNEELWVALYHEYPIKPRGDPDGVPPQVLGRLKTGVTINQANAEFAALARRMGADNPKTNKQLLSASVQPLLNTFTGAQLRQTVFAMLGAVLVVLLIACVNVMNMQLGRSALRAKELAIRGALGATRWRLVRQMVTESFLVAAMGAAFGVMLAYWAVDMLAHSVKALSPPPAYWVVFKIDAPALAFTVAIVVLATIVSGLAPALVSSRTNTAAVMKEGGRGNSSRLVNIITRILVVGQIALAAALLIAAALQVKSIRNQTTLDYGYDEDGIYCARMGLFEGDYPTADARVNFFNRALRSLHSNPAFATAAMTDRFRMTFGDFGKYEVDGQTYATDRDRPEGNSEAISADYFATLELKILEGRDFTVEDNDEKQPVAIVNTSFAGKYFGRESAIGRRVRIFDPARPRAWRTIVGVVPDTMMQGPFNTQTDTSGFYIPLLGSKPAPQFVTIVVRPHPGQRADTLATPLAKAIAELDSNLPTYMGATPKRLHDEVLGGNRIIATLFGIFGLVAFILSAVGLYGVMSFSVSQRMQEFGIRMALGADTPRIFGMVMRQGAWQLGAGLLFGAGAAALLLGVIGASAVANILFKVNALDPFIYCTVAASLTLVAAASCFVPARRATRVSPMVALRTE